MNNKIVCVVMTQDDFNTVVESLDEEINAIEDLIGRGNDFGNKKELLSRLKIAKTNMMNTSNAADLKRR